MVKIKPTLKKYLPHYPVIFLSLMGLLQYSKVLFKGRSVGWDTVDAFFPPHLFFVDCFKKFIFPFYNPFSMGGVSIGHNYITAFMLNPIDILLSLFGTVISPLYMFQVQFPIFSIFSGYWIFCYLKSVNVENILLSLIGGLAYFAAIMYPLAGQAQFFYSFTLLAFLLSPFRDLSVSNNKIYNAFGIMALVSIMLKAYFFFIPFFFLGAFCLMAFDKSLPIKKVIFIFACVSVTYLVLTLPILNYFKSSMADLYGNFISPEPRLRSLVPEKIMYSPSFMSVLGDIIDRYYIPGGAWTRGFNISFVFLFFTQLYLFLTSGGKRVRDFALLFLMVFFIFMAKGAFATLHENLPVLSSFRWGSSYVYFSQICYLFFICSRPFDYSRLKWLHGLCISVGLTILYLALARIQPAVLSFSLISPIILLISVLIFRPRFLLTVVIIFTVIYALIHAKTISLVNRNPIGEYDLTNQRNQKISIEKNERDIGVPGDYLFNERSWLYRKIPSMNGYNSATHPIFWYLKARPESGKIVIPICNEAFFNFGERGTYDPNDNKYMDKLRDDIITGIQKYRCSEEIVNFHATPDEIQFMPVGPYTLILQNVEHFKTISETKKERNFPGGIRIIESEPGKMVQLSYKKSSVAANLVFLIISFGLIFWAGFNSLKEKINRRSC
ncbi:MAG TPA: hypothetical protein VNJ08_02825 [Bacteriovoracaceae bacterium]|nr:hypothetical protein [Bacteriovoracaceae bacterium]